MLRRPTSRLRLPRRLLAERHAPFRGLLLGGAAVGALAGALLDRRRTSARYRADREELMGQRAEAMRCASTLRMILDVAREMAGSLNVRYVAVSLGDAAHRIASARRVVVWLTDGDHLLPVHDSTLAQGLLPDAVAVAIGEGPLGLAARDGRPAVLGGDQCGWAFPLVVGGQVIGVLELVDVPAAFAEDTEPLETLAIHGAAAIETARLHHAAQERADVDALTELLNRRRLDTDLETELARSDRYGRPLGCILLDVDHFKEVNDTFGHQHGDEVLRLFSATLASTLRATDSVYRYGGEEFCVLVREGTLESTVQLAERLRVELGRVFVGLEGFSTVTASFGVAATPEHGTTPEALLSAADAALFAAKRGGRDRVEIAETRVPSMLVLG